MLIRFLSLPVTLGLLTAAYNFARFHSIFDFGYIHIPEVAQEPWYQHGLFSIQAIPWNIYTMLFQGYESLAYFPYIRPNGFGCSIFLASPFLCLAISPGRTIQGGGMGSYQCFNTRTLVAWKPRQLAVLLPLCHDLITVDVSSTDRQWAAEPIRA